MSKLYVSNLSYDVKEVDLKQIFSIFGRVTFVKLLKDQLGRSRGAGFVGLEKKADPQKAVQSYNNSVYAGRTILVKIQPDK